VSIKAERCRYWSWSKRLILRGAVVEEGAHDPAQVPVVALTAYFDGSWTGKPNDPPWLMAVGGFISSEKRWLWFEERWSKLLARFRLKYFQMKEFTTCSGQFDGWREREADRGTRRTFCCEAGRFGVSEQRNQPPVRSRVSSLTKAA
jgi:hypothetical protein